MAVVQAQSCVMDYYPSKHRLDLDTSAHSGQTSEFIGIPKGFPSHYTGDRVWSGADLATEQHKWITILSEQDLLAIQEALQHFQELRVGPEYLSPETFPLPQHLHDKLRALSRDCYTGRGFAVLRGLDADSYHDSEKVLIYGGLSSHVAPIRGYQDIKRELISCHIVSTDSRPDIKVQDIRPAFTNERLAFHTDLGDILALYAMDVSDTGGQTVISSSSMIYNDLAQLRPDLLQELTKPWVFFSSQDYATEKTPLMNNTPGDKLVFQYSRLPVTGFRKEGNNSTLPPPSAKLLEAMTYIEALGWKHALPLPCERGDIAYINNFCTMHARNAFDMDASGRPLSSRRHLVKLMLRDPELTWDLPQSFDWYLQRVFGPNGDNNSRSEKWDLGPEKARGGHIWAGSEGGGMNNG